MRFPTANTYPIHVVSYFGQGESPDLPETPPTSAEWMALLRAKAQPAYPTAQVLHGEYEERYGWGGFGDSDFVATAGDHLVFVRRSWRKRPSPSLFKRILKQREAAKLAEFSASAGHEVKRLPAALRKEMKEALHDELLVNAQPSVVEHVVAINTRTQHVYGMFRPTSGNSGINTEVLRLLESAYGRRVTLSTDSLPCQALEAFGDLWVGPEGWEHRFLPWLAGIARTGQTIQVTLPDRVEALTLSLGDSVKLTRNKDTITYTGEGITSDAFSEDGTTIAQISQLEVTVIDGSGAWSLTLNEDASILNNTSPPVPCLSGDDLAALERHDRCYADVASILLRIQAVERAHQIVRLLTHAFLALDVAPASDSNPQRGLFPLPPHTALTDSVVLLDEAPAQAPDNAPLFGLTGNAGEQVVMTVDPADPNAGKPYFLMPTSIDVGLTERFAAQDAPRDDRKGDREVEHYEDENDGLGVEVDAGDGSDESEA